MASKVSSTPVAQGRPARRVAVKRRRRGRPPHAEAVRFRRHLLEIALEVFLESGYAGSSIDGIARRAKISKNTVYLQYGTKHDLFRAAALEALASVRSQLDTSIDEDAPLEAVLSSVISRVQSLAGDPAVRGLARLLIAESQRFPDIAAAMFEEARHLFEPVTRYLALVVRRGLLCINNPVAAAQDLSILALGGFDFLLAEPSTSPAVLSERAAEVLRLVLDGWRVRRKK